MSTDPQPLSPTELVDRLVDLRTADTLGAMLCDLRAQTLARDELVDRLFELVDNGTLMRWAGAFEREQCDFSRQAGTRIW